MDQTLIKKSSSEDVYELHTSTPTSSTTGKDGVLYIYTCQNHCSSYIRHSPVLSRTPPGLQLRYLAANSSMILSIFCASPGKWKLTRKALKNQRNNMNMTLCHSALGGIGLAILWWQQKSLFRVMIEPKYIRVKLHTWSVRGYRLCPVCGQSTWGSSRNWSWDGFHKVQDCRYEIYLHNIRQREHTALLVCNTMTLPVCRQNELNTQN